eukprot:s7027_g5.t2
MASCRWRELLSELTRELEQQSLKLRDLEKENQRLNDSRLSPHAGHTVDRRLPCEFRAIGIYHARASFRRPPKWRISSARTGKRSRKWKPIAFTSLLSPGTRSLPAGVTTAPWSMASTTSPGTSSILRARGMLLAGR